MGEPSGTDFERVRKLLTERGVTSLDSLMDEIEAQGLSPATALNTIRWWDDLPASTRGTGLLVTKLRDGGVSGYRRAHEREKVDGEIVSLEHQMSTLRNICLTADGIDRETAESMYAKVAANANMSAKQLVDEAVCAEWAETPPHPVNVFTRVGDPEGIIRYLVWMQRNRLDEETADQPRPWLRPKEGESEFAFSCRFWGWRDPPELKERAQRFEAKRKAALAERNDGGHLIAAQAVSVAPQRQEEPTPPPASAVVVAEPPPSADDRWGDVPWTDGDLGPDVEDW